MLLKEITYYYQCGDFPCRLIRNLERSYNSRYKESPVENSEIVKGNGVFYFISWKHTPLDTPARNVAALSHCTTRFARSTEKEHDKNEDKKIYACWIYVSDLQRSKKFYRNIGFEIKAIDGDRIEFDLGETSFAILKRTGEKR